MKWKGIAFSVFLTALVGLWAWGLWQPMGDSWFGVAMLTAGLVLLPLNALGLAGWRKVPFRARMESLISLSGATLLGASKIWPGHRLEYPGFALIFVAIAIDVMRWNRHPTTESTQ